MVRRLRATAATVHRPSGSMAVPLPTRSGVGVDPSGMQAMEAVSLSVTI